MKPRVVYWNNIPAPYMVERFNAVARRDNLDFEAWFSAPTEQGRSWEVDEEAWVFHSRYLPRINGLNHSLTIPMPTFSRHDIDVLVSLYAGPAFLLGWAAAAARRHTRTAFWVEVTFDAWVRRYRWKEAVKSAILPRADAVLTAGRDGADFAMKYGVPPARIFVVPHVVDFEHYARHSALAAEREVLRARLGVRGVTFVYVGRLWLGKGLDYLVQAFAELQRSSDVVVSLLFVGDGPDERLLRERSRGEGLDNIVFAGFHEGKCLPRLLGAADVFVFPTLGDPFGMVVSEAMACGLPIISSSASGEIRDRVSDGVNGFVVPPADAGALRDAMSALAADADARRRMGDASRERVRGQSPEMWAEAFESAVEEILARPRSRRWSRLRVPRE